MPMIRVNNNRAAGHVLPPIGEFPMRTLLPGGNNVESEYLDALKAHMCAPTLALKPSGAPEEDRNGNPIVIHARGEGLWTKFLLSNPHLTFLSPEASVEETAKPEGPPPPKDVLDRQVEVAKAFVEVESDPAVLNLWLKAEQRTSSGDRESVRTAIKQRLGELKSSKR